MARPSAAPDAADPVVLDGFAADAHRSKGEVARARQRLSGTTIAPNADRFGLLTDLIRQHDEAKEQVVTALAGLADGFGDLDTSAGQFAEAFRVAGEVR